jgi:DNA helicase II / ATP-dependent DNA helicase PcrA
LLPPEHLKNNLRSGQIPLAEWQGGEMAVSAVPGAGKSHSLAIAAAMTIARHRLNNRQQLVVVTYTRSAAANIKLKIRDRLRELALPQAGFSVHTLHGLALNIASRHPELSGIDLDAVTLITPNQNHRLIRTAVERWLDRHPDEYGVLLTGTYFDGEETERLRRQSVLRTEVLPDLAKTAIKEAKCSGWLPADVWELSQQTKDNYGVLAIAAGLYQEYQELMRSRDLLDYDDMILAALRVLENSSIRQLWQKKIFAVFEDEAQDSSPLQEKLLFLLAQHPELPDAPPNLVRVGDPNQAINSTFTPADPIYFNWFCQRCEKQSSLATMDGAGRSSKIIIAAANEVLHWVNQRWAIDFGNNSEVESPFRSQDIQSVPSDDPQNDANPAPEGKGLEIYTPIDIFQTVELIGDRIYKLLSKNPDHNAAILVRENRQGRFLAQQLAYLERDFGIRVYEVSETERFSQIPIEVLKLLKFIDRPHSPDNLKAALEILQSRSLIATQDFNALIAYPEQFLYPTPLEPQTKPQIELARRYCCDLLQARIELPHYHLISFLGMQLNYSGAELATLQKLGDRLDRQIIGKSSLKTSIAILEEIIATEQFEGVEEDSEKKYIRTNQVTIITMHKAKGLDWDYVFIPFLHEDVIPGEPWIRNSAKFLGEYTLSEVARAQLRVAVHSQYRGETPYLPSPQEAWKQAGLLQKAEEYRLLYVAMTRAKRLLWLGAEQEAPFRWSIFKNDGRSNLRKDKKPCPAIPMLMSQFPKCVMDNF